MRQFMGHTVALEGRRPHHPHQRMEELHMMAQVQVQQQVLVPRIEVLREKNTAKFLKIKP